MRLASSKPAANLSVYLVQLPWTQGAGRHHQPDHARLGRSAERTRQLKNGGDYHAMERGKPLAPGQFVTLTFDLQPDDQIIPAGKRIALMILSSDRDFTLWPKPGTELTVDLDATTIRLPVVGGADAFRKAVK